MDQKPELHPGTFIRCSGCQGEIHASENDGPADKPFRCRSCRNRHLDTFRAMYGPMLSLPGDQTSGSKPNDNSEAESASARSGRGRDRSTQQKTVE